MKRTVLITALIAMGSALMAQTPKGDEPEKSKPTPLRSEQFLTRPAMTLHQPLQGDSVNLTGKRLGVEDMLKSKVSMHFDAANSTLMPTDTAGYLYLEPAADPNASEEVKKAAPSKMYLLKTRLRAERFSKGTLEISSPARLEVFVNGQSRQTKTQADDSLKAVKPLKVALTLEPEADQDIVIRLLAMGEDKLAPCVKCEYRPDEAYTSVGAKLDATMKRRYSLHNSNFRNLTRSVSLSYDGRYLITMTQDYFDLKNYRSTSQLIEVKTGRIITAHLDRDWRWMPRSTKLYRVEKGAEGYDLFTLDPTTQRQEMVAQGLPEERFTWAPTEDYLICSIEDEGETVNGPLKRLLHPDDRIPGSRSRSHIARYDLATGVMERLTYGSHSVYLNDISADGQRLLCSTSRDMITRCPFSESALFEINLGTMKVDTLVAWDPYINRASYSPDGSQLLVIGSPSAFNGIGKNCDPQPVANDFDTQAFIVNKATKEVDPITKEFNPTVTLVSWNPTNGLIYFNTTDADNQHIYSYNPKSRQFEMLPLSEDVISRFDLPDGNPTVAAYIGGGSYSAGVSYLYDMKRRTSKLLANPLKPMLDEIEMGTVEPWQFTAADGTLIDGLICLPPAFDAQKKYPLIVYYYGGTTPTTKGIGSPYSPQVFASRDYVVYVIQPSGAIGYGQEFSARHVNAWGDYTANEIIEGTQKFLAAHPFVDAKRVGCIGASYGGFMTQYLQTKTDLFTCAVSHAGISNVTSYWGEGYWGYSYNAVAAAFSYPWQNPDLFTKHGSLFNADKINTPLLLLHGTSDTNVPTGESIQIYNALKILGKTVEFITVDGEDHYISDYPKREQWHKAIMAWFARYLQDSPDWWNELYPERHW